MNPRKVALVTGAGKQRVGRTVAGALAARGYGMVIHYLTSEAEAAETVAALRRRGADAIAVRAVEEFGGAVPCDRDVLLSFRGVGPKCANLALGIACGEACIGVDVHVHRVTNRWGYVRAATPEQTMVALEAVLPRRHWLEINRLLVPFGKHICTGTLPKCSTCPVLDMCRQVGVTSHR